MPSVPYLDTADDPGIYQVLTTANTDYVLNAPNDATGLVIWFETSASNSTLVTGRIGLSEDNTAITGITGSGVKLGYHPAQPVEYNIEKSKRAGAAVRTFTTPYTVERYIHLACPTALAVARGYWLTRYE